MGDSLLCHLRILPFTDPFLIRVVCPCCKSLILFAAKVTLSNTPCCPPSTSFLYETFFSATLSHLHLSFHHASYVHQLTFFIAIISHLFPVLYPPVLILEFQKFTVTPTSIKFHPPVSEPTELCDAPALLLGQQPFLILPRVCLDVHGKTWECALAFTKLLQFRKCCRALPV